MKKICKLVSLNGLILISAVLAGCGQKGPLTLPEKAPSNGFQYQSAQAMSVKTQEAQLAFQRQAQH